MFLAQGVGDIMTNTEYRQFKDEFTTAHASRHTVTKLRASMGAFIASKLVPIAGKAFRAVKHSMPQLRVAAQALRDNFRASEGVPHTAPQKFRAMMNGRLNGRMMTASRYDTEPSVFTQAAPLTKAYQGAEHFLSCPG